MADSDFDVNAARAYAGQLEQRYGLPAGLVSSIVQQESSWRPGAVSKANRNGSRDYGIMQINESNLDRFGLTPDTATKDWQANMNAGAAVLAEGMKRYNGDPAAAVAAYNAGPNAVDAALAGKAALPASTMDYLSKVGGSMGWTPGQTGPNLDAEQANIDKAHNDLLNQTMAQLGQKQADIINEPGAADEPLRIAGQSAGAAATSAAEAEDDIPRILDADAPAPAAPSYGLRVLAGADPDPNDAMAYDDAIEKAFGTGPKAVPDHVMKLVSSYV